MQPHHKREDADPQGRPHHRAVAEQPLAGKGRFNSIKKVAVRTGKAATINRLAASAVQQNTGIVMPGARNLRIVVTKLTPVSNVPTPDICNDQR
jgi:hypothetical protein